MGEEVAGREKAESTGDKSPGETRSRESGHSWE